jgi:hypothetical protein
MKKNVRSVMVSRKGRSVRVVCEDGDKLRFDFDNYLKVFHDWERAKNEYLLQIWYFLSSYTDLDDEKIKKILKTVRERLTTKQEVILPI